MSSFAKNKDLVSKVAAHLAARADEPVWQAIPEGRQREYLAQAMGLLDVVDESASEPDAATALCAHCPTLVLVTEPRCKCHDWPLCGKCRKKTSGFGHKKRRGGHGS